LLLDFNLYALSVLSFVQLIVSTLLVLSPAREIGARYRWTGSRITEVVVGSMGAVGIAAASCVLTHALWGLPISQLETAAYLLVLVSAAVIALQPDRNLVGQVFYASFASASLSFAFWAAYLAVVAPHSILETITATFVLLISLAAFVVWMSNVNYQSDVLTRARRGRPLPKADPSYRPMVSLHIPAYNEPPELLIETIKSVELIDYPNFEVVVIDNNTQDPAVWGPVEEYCRDRPRVKFAHVAPWPGYKAGACNLALREYTDPRAEIIGLVDADDLVKPYYLKETASYFSDPEIGFVQTFEGNRDFEGNSYYTACVNSYQAFYLSVMSARNERNTVPFVGTMGLFRRSALNSVGGWNEWCICEDTEASLRVLRDGWSGLYIPRCFGRGIVPPSWAGMLTQRHRWCFGAMQILRLHWRSLMPWNRSPDNHLTAAQRRDYLMASVGWFRDFLMFAFSLVLIAVSALSVAHSSFAVAPLVGQLSLLPLSIIVTATIPMMVTLRNWTTLSYRQALLSLVISLAVTVVIARGCIEGAARRDGVFLRTSKAGGRRTILTALSLTRWETLLAAALYVSAVLLAGKENPPWLLVFIVFTQATVYLCGPVVAVWNLRAQAAGPREPASADDPTPVRRPPRVLVPRPLAALLVAVCIGVVASVFVFPVPLLHATTVAPPFPQSLLAAPRTEVYLRLGSSATGPAGAYYPITPMHLSGLAVSSPNASTGVGLTFTTSSTALLGGVLRAAEDNGEISAVGIAFRTPGPAGRPMTRLVDTFGPALVTSISEPAPAAPVGSVSLLLSAPSAVTRSSVALRHAGPFAPRAAPPATRAIVTLGQGSPSFAVTAVSLSRSSPGAPLNVGFSTTAPSLLQRLVQAQGAATVLPLLTLSVWHGPAGSPVRRSFSKVSVSAFTESFSTPFSGTASLAVPSH
jgi:cellulose synthase/poly-beta-1,6-N-acetylglucosamine synthase-like glycosyltransferase